MSITDLYPERVRQTHEALADATEAWLEDIKAQVKLFQTAASGHIAPAPALGNAVQLAKGLIEANVRYTKGFVSASLGVVGSVGQSARQGATAVKDDVVATVDGMERQVDHFEDGLVENAQELRRAERAEARRAKKAARDAAAARYEHMTKVELSEELAQRRLPKTGNVGELRDRLMEADLQDDA